MTLESAFRDQSTSCANLGSPFMARLLTLLADHWPSETKLAAKCDTFEGDIGPVGHSLPLRIAGGLHALRLNGDSALDAVYPPHTPSDATFKEGILDALIAHDIFLTEWIDSAPQTNELRRSAALIPAAMIVAQRFELPFWVSELGASGGLNLMWDQFALEAEDWRVGNTDPAVTLRPEWTGPAPIGGRPVVSGRRGVDLNPLDPTHPDDLLRLTAYLWADQPYRLDMTRAAAGAVAAPVDKADAVDWLESRLAAAPKGHAHLIQNTVAWQYFPPQQQARGRKMIEDVGAKASTDAPLAWLQLENDGDRDGLGGGAITLQMWPGGDILHLGRADFHGRWVKWIGEPSN
ncbi:MAG: DUF2332 family protein [Aliishimia sp.]